MTSKEHWWLRAAFLAYAVGILIFRDAIMDDTFINLQYARNLRSAGELAFNPGEPSLGATSTLWIFLLAALGDGVQAARWASLACGALAVLVFSRLARRWLHGGFAAAATITWAGSLWLVRHAPNGMETTAGALFILLAVELRSREGASRTRDVGLGLTLAAAWLVRPEALLFVALAVLFDLRSSTGRARLLVWMPACMAPSFAWILFAHAHVGHVLPATEAAKSGGLQLAPLVWLRQLWREARIVGAAHAVESLGLLLALGLSLRLDGFGALRRLWRQPQVPYALFSLGLLLAYAVFDVQVQPRYVLLVTPCLVLAGFAAWQEVLGSAPAFAASVCAASLGAGVIVGAHSVYPATRDFADGMRKALVPMALEVARHGGAGTAVATPDIGVMGYLSGAYVLDLGGLVDRRVQRLVARYGYDTMLEQGLFLDVGRVEYVVDRSLERERFRDHVTRGLRWQPVMTCPVRGLGISRPQTYYYTLYTLGPDTAFGRAGEEMARPPSWLAGCP